MTEPLIYSNVSDAFLDSLTLYEFLTIQIFSAVNVVQNSTGLVKNSVQEFAYNSVYLPVTNSPYFYPFLYGYLLFAFLVLFTGFCTFLTITMLKRTYPNTFLAEKSNRVPRLLRTVKKLKKTNNQLEDLANCLHLTNTTHQTRMEQEILPSLVVVLDKVFYNEPLTNRNKDVKILLSFAEEYGYVKPVKKDRSSLKRKVSPTEFENENSDDPGYIPKTKIRRCRE